MKDKTRIPTAEMSWLRKLARISKTTENYKLLGSNFRNGRLTDDLELDLPLIYRLDLLGKGRSMCQSEDEGAAEFPLKALVASLAVMRRVLVVLSVVRQEEEIKREEQRRVRTPSSSKNIPKTSLKTRRSLERLFV